MKSSVFTMLVSTVFISQASAEDGVTCTNPTAADAWLKEVINSGITDAASCKTACDAKMTDAAMDYCCSADKTGAGAGTVSCKLYNKATGNGKDIREAKPTSGDNVYSAWAKVAGVDSKNFLEGGQMLATAAATLAAAAALLY